MKKFAISLWFFCALLGLSAQNLNYDWAKRIGGIGVDAGTGPVIGENGNLYLNGFFNGTVDFDPGTGVFNLTSAGVEDGFILKLNPNGEFIWAIRFGGTGVDIVRRVLHADGYLYVTGIFNGTVDFDPGPGVFNLTSAGGRDIFILKLTENGSFVWAKRLGGTGDEGEIGVILNNNYFLIVGNFQNTVDFNLDAGVFNLTSAGSYDGFIAKYNLEGEFITALRIGGVENDEIKGIAIGESENIYITGIFRTTVDFDPGAGVFNLTSAGANDVFVLKLNANGGFIWARRVGNSLPDDDAANIVFFNNEITISGNFQGTVDFDPGAGVFNLTSAGSSDAFMFRLNANADFVWAKRVGGTGAEYSNGAGYDVLGNYYLIGTFQGTADFDPDAGVANLTSAGGDDTFVLKLSPNGSFVWANRIGGPSNDYAFRILIDNKNLDIYFAGSFQGTADFDPGAGVANLTSAGSDDIFIAKYTQCPPASLSPATLPNGFFSYFYSQTLSQTGLNGTITWVVANGNLPAGLSLNPSTGEIRGTPTAITNATFTIVAHNGTCVAGRTYTLSILDPITSISPDNTTSLKAYPNPVADDLLVETLNSNAPFRFEVRSLQGAILLRGSSLQSQQKISLKNLPQGIYILGVQSEKGEREYIKVTKL